MVSRFDEHLVHQTEQPLARVASDHPQWQDRFYFSIHDRNGARLGNRIDEAPLLFR
ncbi:MAG TPA: hypothetical protein VJL07_06650 [Dehalococcoidia bacterium]|nr:hypothetical protein [Dehalococcoidia bacterium]